MINVPHDLIDFVKGEFGCRSEIGAAFWREDPSDQSKYAYTYAESVAIAIMMAKGWSMDDAASLVDAGLVIAVPFVHGVTSPRVSVPDFVYSVGHARLCDGSIWEALGDLDLPQAQDFIANKRCLHGAVSVRALEICNEPVKERIAQLVTVGEIDASGRFVLDARYGAHQPAEVPA